MTPDPRIDPYIARAQPFAQTILRRIRAAVRAGCPEVTETNAKAKKTYEAFSPSAQREYVEWITGAKTDETRDTRLATAVAWMAEGKQRNWKYMPGAKKK